MVVRYIRDQAVSVLKVCSGMVVNVQLSTHRLVEEWRTAYGGKVDAIVNLDFIRREDLVFVMGWPIIIIVIDAI